MATRTAVWGELVVGNRRNRRAGSGAHASTPRAWALNASWTSHTSICSGAQARPLDRQRNRPRRGESHHERIERVDRRWTPPAPAVRRRARRPSRRRPATTALAPSESGVELAAVICVVPGCDRQRGQCLGGGVVADELVVLGHRARASSWWRRSARAGSLWPTGRESRAALGVLLGAQCRRRRSPRGSASSGRRRSARSRSCRCRRCGRASFGLGGPPAPAHMVSSRMHRVPSVRTGRHLSCSAQPERDIDSAPQAMPDAKVAGLDRVRRAPTSGAERRCRRTG